MTPVNSEQYYSDDNDHHHETHSKSNLALDTYDEDNEDNDSQALLFDEHGQPHGDAHASNARGFFAVVKSFVGTGMLFLPRAFYNGGTIFSPIVFVALSAMALICMLRLLECWRTYHCSFGRIGQQAFGLWGRIAVDVSLIATQVGICCVFMIFVAEHIQQLIAPTWKMSHLILLEIPILALISWVRRLWKLGFINIIAVALISYGLAYIYYYDIYTYAKEGIKETAYFNKHDFALFLGTSIYTFEGIGTMVPIQESMAKPNDFPKILTMGVTTVTVAFISFGLMGYLAFGEEVYSPITLNLPADDPWVQSVLWLYAIAVYFSYPLMLFPVIRITEPLIFREKFADRDMLRKWLKNAYRAFLVILTACIAIVGSDDFDAFVSVIGGLCCAPLAFIFPAMFHYKLKAETLFQRVTDVLIAVVGVICMVLATVVSIKSWIEGE